MSASFLKVTPEQLGSIASSVESAIDDYTANYSKIYEEAEMLATAWKGPASEAFLSRINSFENDFKSLNNLLLAYVDFLRTAEANYQTNENEVIDKVSHLTVGR